MKCVCYFVVDFMASELTALAGLHSQQPYFPLMQKYIAALYKPMFERVGGWDKVCDVQLCVVCVCLLCVCFGVFSL